MKAYKLGEEPKDNYDESLGAGQPDPSCLDDKFLYINGVKCEKVGADGGLPHYKKCVGSE